MATVLTLGTGFGPGASADAATVLHRAADNTISTTDPVLGRGQFLELTTTTSESVSGPGGTGWQERSTRTLYIPQLRSDTWYLVRAVQKPTVFYTPASRAAAETWWKHLAAQGAQVAPGKPVIEAGKGGKFAKFDYSEDGADGVSISALPSDPHLLLAYLYAKSLGLGSSPNVEAMSMIGDLLRTGRVPASERSSLFRSAALIPGVTLTDNQAVLDGRTGVAIGMKTTQGQVQDIVIDPHDGTVIGERDMPTTNLHGLVLGTAGYFTAVTTAVTDTAPTAPNAVK